MSERGLLVASAAAERPPFLSVAIPQYNRRAHLEAVLETLFAQSFEDFEIVVSDDGSSDDSAEVIPALLRSSRRPFRYYRQAENLGYDRNVRFCIDASEGRYVMLLGNDDGLLGDRVLTTVAEQLEALGFPEVAVTNYSDLRTRQTHRRGLATAVLGAGPEVALAHYRSFSFVSGIVYNRELAQRHRDDFERGTTTFYQVLVACRIIAAGGRYATLALDAIEASIPVGGEHGANWTDILAGEPRSFEPRDNLSGWLLLAVQRAVLPQLPPERRSEAIRRILNESYAFSYPLGLVEARRGIRWSFAFGYARGLWPPAVYEHFVDGPPPERRDRLRIWLVYLPVTAAGLLLPVRLLSPLRPRLADLVRRLKLRTEPD